MQTAYWTILLLLSVLAAWRRPPVIARATLAILGCGVASLILVPLLHWPSDNYAFAMMFVDAVAAVIVLKPPPSLWGAVIGATYLTQIGLHASKIISHPRDMSSYFAGLSLMAWIQLAVVGVWWLDESFARRRAVHGHGKAAAPAHRTGDGQ